MAGDWILVFTGGSNFSDCSWRKEKSSTGKFSLEGDGTGDVSREVVYVLASGEINVILGLFLNRSRRF